MGEKRWYTIKFSAKLTKEDLRAMQKCFFEAMEEAMLISECSDLVIEEECCDDAST